jgi:hypothetical protein
MPHFLQINLKLTLSKVKIDLKSNPKIHNIKLEKSKHENPNQKIDMKLTKTQRRMREWNTCYERIRERNTCYVN